MTWRQVLTLLAIASVMVVDGFDILSMGVAAPGIVKEFKIAPETLGWVLSMELIGSAIGAVLMGGVVRLVPSDRSSFTTRITAPSS